MLLLVLLQLLSEHLFREIVLTTCTYSPGLVFPKMQFVGKTYLKPIELIVPVVIRVSTSLTTLLKITGCTNRMKMSADLG